MDFLSTPDAKTTFLVIYLLALFASGVTTVRTLRRMPRLSLHMLAVAGAAATLLLVGDCAGAGEARVAFLHFAHGAGSPARVPAGAV
jgi:hypothetical protein